MGHQENAEEKTEEKLICLYKNIKEINKKLSNGITSQLKEYRDLCHKTTKIIGELDAPIKIE